MPTEAIEFGPIYIKYFGETFKRTLILESDLTSGNFIETGYLVSGLRYKPWEIIEAIRKATHCIRRNKIVWFFKLEILESIDQNGICYDGNTFRKVPITIDETVDVKYEYIACLIVGIDYSDEGIEEIKRTTTHYYQSGRAYFFYREIQ